MLVDGRTLPDGERLEADVCIIGCGPAGITVARELGATGMEVTVLESGGPERTRAADALGAGESVGHPYALGRSRARGIGGTSLHWEMHTDGGDEGWLARPLDPLDLEARAAIPDSGWPLPWSELEELYRRAQQVAHLSSLGFSLASAGGPERPLDVSPAEVVTNLFERGAATFASYRGDLAASTAVRVVHHATVLELVAQPGTARVAAAAAATGPDRRVLVAARRFVLATGGVENARFLMLPQPGRPRGWGNEYDLVGRYFMERLSARAGVIVPEGAMRGSMGLYRSHVAGGRRIQATLSLAPEVVRAEGLRNAAFWLRERPADFTADGISSVVTLGRVVSRRPRRLEAIPPHVVSVARDLPAIARLATARLRRPTSARPELIQLGVQAEQAPNPASRVTLGERRDRFGRPVPRLDWQPTAADRDSIVRSVRRLDGALRHAGLGHITRPFGSERAPGIYVGNWHHLGTTRMHRDPAHGVVDADSRVHGVPNLYVAGSSVFPTAGFANPTLTIVALALRLADHLRAARVGDPPA